MTRSAAKRAQNFLAGLLLQFFALHPAPAQDLSADLTSHIISINSRFEGADLVAFGIVEGGGDIIITVRGPEQETIIRRKSRIAGIWLNGRGVNFIHVPQFYAIMANKPPETLLSVEARRLNGIGPASLSLPVAAEDAGRSAQEIAEFRRALVASMQDLRLYPTEPRPVEFLSPKLFRATMRFPANVPVGTYTATVFLIRGGAVAASETIPLIVSRSGFAAEVHDFADDQALAFGIFAVIAAIMAGWTGSILFRGL